MALPEEEAIDSFDRLEPEVLRGIMASIPPETMGRFFPSLAGRAVVIGGKLAYLASDVAAALGVDEAAMVASVPSSEVIRLSAGGSAS